MSVFNTVIAWIWIVIQTSSSLECNNNEQCKEQDINGNTVSCAGASSCFNSPSTITTSGDLNCDGYLSCAQSDRNVGGNLACRGYQSCQNGDINAGALLLCDGSAACQANPTIIAQNAACDGYYSCTPKGNIEQTVFRVSNTLKCGGSNACQGWGGTLAIGGKLYCDGYQSCKSDTIDAAGSGSSRISLVECNGDGACMNTFISNVDSLKLSGSMAAYGTNIKGAASVCAYGRSSLWGATIDSEGVTKMDVKLYGLAAGFNADITCRPGTTCKLSCKGDACQTTTFRCLGNAKCRVSPKRCMKDGVMEYQGIDCPIMTDSEDLITINQMKVSYTLNLEDYDPEIIAETNIYQCDNANECKRDTIDSSYNKAACNGLKSCCRVQSSVSGNVECYGLESCESATINSDGAGSSPAINCYGTSSCQRATYDASSQSINSGVIACNGDTSCKHMEPIPGITHQKKIKCNGKSGCYGMNYKLDNTAGYLRCDGAYSCKGAHIISGRYLGCYGRYSCQHAFINMTGNQDLECHGKLACDQATIDTDRSVFVWGSLGARDAYISATTLAVQSYYGIAGATIDSLNRNPFVSLYGHYSGRGATMICREGSKCTLRCYGTACKEMDYICLSTDLNNCKVEPAQCALGIDESVNGIDCPLFKTSLTKSKNDALADDEEYQEEERQIKEDEEMFNELMEDDNVKHRNKNKNNELFGGVHVAHIQTEGTSGSGSNVAMGAIIGGCGALSMIIALLVYFVCFTKKNSKDGYQSLV